MTDPAITPDSRAAADGRASRGTLAEACVVYGATVGVSAVATLAIGIDRRQELAFTNAHLLSVVGTEVVLSALLVPWLRRRGWTPAAAAGAPAPLDTLRGAGVWVLAYACFVLAWIVFAILAPEAARALAAARRFTGIPASPAVIVVASVVNPVFEEFLWLGYGVMRLAPRLGNRWAVGSSVLLRVAVHVYQGPLALISVLPLAIAFTWYYGRTRRLWPVVVAHVLFDAMGLALRLPVR